MAKSSKVNIKLEIYKDKDTGKLSLLVRFDTKASNLIVEKYSYAWMPTPEEIELINEAFSIFSMDRISIDKTAATKTFSTEKIIEKHLEKPLLNENPNDGTDNKEVEKGEKLVKVGDDLVEDTIKKHIGKEDDELIREADEHTIIDKVLNQKKKGRWKKL